MSVIPAEWKRSSVGAIASSSRNAIVGGPFGSDLVSQDYVAHGVPVIRGQNMGGRWVSGDFAFVSSAKARALEANQAHPGDIVFTQRGTLGQVSLVPETPFRAYVVSQSQMKLSVDERIANPLFVFYYFTSDEQQKLIHGSAIQTGVPHINLAILRSLPVRLPPLEQQQAIASALSDVDELVESLQMLIAKRRAIKQAAMQQLLTGRTRLPGFGGQWEAIALDQITIRTTGYWGAARPSSTALHPVRVIRAGDISQSGALTGFASRYFGPVELTKASCAPGDVVITVSGNGLGKTWLVDRNGMAGSNFVRILKAIPSRTSGPFLAFSLRSAVALEQLVEHTATSAYPNLLPSFFNSPWLPLPPLPEQRAIATVLSDMDAEITALEHRLDKTCAIKQGMMQQLLTGSIRLPIPEDETRDDDHDV